MKILVIGGAGYVGTILRPALEAKYDCRYLDLRPVPGAEDRTFVGSLQNPRLLYRALYTVDSVVFLAMGIKPESWENSEWWANSFDVNAKGHFRVLTAMMHQRVRHMVYASTLSVYRSLRRRLGTVVNENVEPDALEGYGLSKRMAEQMNHVFARKHLDASFVSLRLMWPRNEADWPGNEYQPGLDWYPIGPHDLRAAFLAALEFRHPGAYAVQTTGDLGGEIYPNDEATRLLGWKPEGR